MDDTTVPGWHTAAQAWQLEIGVLLVLYQQPVAQCMQCSIEHPDLSAPLKMTAIHSQFAIDRHCWTREEGSPGLPILLPYREYSVRNVLAQILRTETSRSRHIKEGMMYEEV